ncbi:diaminopimelate epimerase [Corynebacterium kozikiae]|uniref:diaminopimelate epimerase n=1 Tax=Corynebacterium kozikiae TaxID=2968469 RepID=UPI00211BBAF6|nr:diaminopimelate epimerase [Corynebacterium sp. 76QC2CO]
MNTQEQQTAPHRPASIPFAKGHGTQNDFIILEDPRAELNLTPELVATLCDRRAGIGADGVLRVATTKALRERGVLHGEDLEGIEDTDYFMDYYNADGSIAQMCGNGTRVFAHWVRSRGHVDQDQFTVGTRAGAKPVTVHACTAQEATVSVDMGPAVVTGVSTTKIGEHTYAGLGVDMGNPHLACVVPGLSVQDLAALDLVTPVFDKEFFPEGVNVEIATELRNGEIHMRVFERGVGETRSCGTGTVAAARSALADAGQGTGEVTVHVPGGAVQVSILDEGSVLKGPSKIVATGVLNLAAL